ncbi:hypothetical protein [Thermomonospora cellulosilytica]|uniref:Uncharacterized protein n=1 Tax=Thermomonospora cellulosilytica TaxID=1411118 RepID=A0A7W3R957_9ACTN|nr:hypothetical protein [Thermomonospora cellulosilytica]MBA9004397.1 hypothetical protein [Thermomonospora cellulosilytica]
MTGAPGVLGAAEEVPGRPGAGAGQPAAVVTGTGRFVPDADTQAART